MKPKIHAQEEHKHADLLTPTTPEPEKTAPNTSPGRKAREKVSAPGGQLPAEIVPMTPMQLMRRAVEAGNLDLVERLLSLQERVDANTAQKAFDGAMCAAQAEMRPVSKDAANTQTRSRYATFEALDRKLRPIYSRHGFSLSFDTDPGAPEGYVRVVCYVAAHGRERKHSLDMPCDGKGAKGGDVMTKTHAMMSAVTYARRGLLKMIFNIAEGNGGGEDDDGNAAGGKPVETINMEQTQKIHEAIKRAGVTEALFCKVYKVATPADLPTKEFYGAIGRLERKAKDNKQ